MRVLECYLTEPFRLGLKEGKAMTTLEKATGFKIPKRTARLVFEGDYDGAEIVVRLDVPVKTFLQIQDLIQNEQQFEVFQVFGETIIDEWNLEDDDGKPLPANGQGMYSIPIDLANIIMTKWSEVAVQAPDPLENN